MTCFHSHESRTNIMRDVTGMTSVTGATAECTTDLFRGTHIRCDVGDKVEIVVVHGATCAWQGGSLIGCTFGHT